MKNIRIYHINIILFYESEAKKIEFFKLKNGLVAKIKTHFSLSLSFVRIYFIKDCNKVYSNQSFLINFQIHKRVQKSPVEIDAKEKNLRFLLSNSHLF